MSTKNLARTGIEGGRYRYNRALRRYSNSAARRRSREVASSLCTTRDPEDALFTPRQQVWRMFYDKLAPGRRWLRSQVGRPWNKVRSELFARFDTRTTAGRHILFCHLLPDVEQNGGALRRGRRFYVSAHGILCCDEPGRRQRKSKQRKR